MRARQRRDVKSKVKRTKERIKSGFIVVFLLCVFLKVIYWQRLMSLLHLFCRSGLSVVLWWFHFSFILNSKRKTRLIITA